MQYRIKNSGIVYLLTVPNGKNLKTGIIIFPGFPNIGNNDEYIKILSSEGYYILEPKYIGSWESYGKFNLENCIKTVVKAENFFRRGHANECWSNKSIKWSLNEMIILSSSFGSAVVLSVAHRLKTNKFICLAPLTNLNKHNKDKNIDEQDLKQIGVFVKRGFENIYREFDITDWNSFSDGKSIVNPIKVVHKLENKKILLLHGKKDNVINYKRTKEYFNRIKIKNQVVIKFYNKLHHGTELKKHAKKDVIDWIRLNT